MTAEEQIDFIRFLFEQWKMTKRELIVFNAVFNALRSENPQLETVLDKMLENGRNSETIRKYAESRFEGF
jgi:hypothetical protein